MNTTATAPIATEISELLDRQGAVFAETTNPWGGLDFQNAECTRTVRIALDDTHVRLFVLEGRVQLVAAEATFVNIPAGVIVAAVAAYLA